MSARYQSTTHSSREIKSILLLAGSFTFAFLAGEMTHEFGHYLAHLFYHTPNVQVHLDPFGNSRITGVTSMPLDAAGVTSAAGPLFNLLVGLAFFLLLWRFRQPQLLPLLLWVPTAMIQEGVTFSLGLLTPGGDAQWIVASGIPEFLILSTGILLLLVGCVVMTLLLPVAGIEKSGPYGKNLRIVSIGMCSLMLLRSIHSFILFPRGILENLIPLVFSLLLAVIVVALYQPVAAIRREITSLEPAPLSWSAIALAIILGMSVFLFQVFALN